MKEQIPNQDNPSKVWNADTRLALAGWAPGHYLRKCFKCQLTFLGDKRALACAPCAYNDKPKMKANPLTDHITITVRKSERDEKITETERPETVRLEITMRVLELHTIEREVNKADFDKQRESGDVASWLEDKFRDDPMPDSDISTESFELDEWKVSTP